MRGRLIAVAIALLVATAATSAIVGAQGDESAGSDVSAAVAEQLRYIDPASSTIVALDLRYGGRNWGLVRKRVARGLSEYRSHLSVRARRRAPRTLGDLIDSVVGFDGIVFDRNFKPVLDGYLVVGVTTPPREPLPPDVEAIEESIVDAFYDRDRKAYLGEDDAIVRHPDGRRVTRAEGERARRLIEARDDAAEPRVVVTYRTHSNGLRPVAEKLNGGRRLEPLKRRPGVVMLDEEIALVDGNTVVFASGPDGSRSASAPSPHLLQALDRPAGSGGFPPAELASLQAAGGAPDPMILLKSDMNLGRWLVGDPAFERAHEQVPYLRAVQSFTGELTIDEDSADAVVRVATAPEELSDADLPVGPPGTLELPNRGDVIGAASLNQSFTTAFGTRLARAVFAGSRFVRAIGRAERALAISFEDEFLRQFDCPSASAAVPQRRAFAARSCVRDPERMRELLPRLAPHLPKILEGLESLEPEGLLGLLLVAPDAPLTPSALSNLAAVVVKPVRGNEGAREQLYELDGLRRPRSRLRDIGPDRVVFGMIGDSFVVASDKARARSVAGLGTRPHDVEAGGAIRVPAKLLFDEGPGDGPAHRALERVVGDLSLTAAADRSSTRLTGRLRLKP